MTSTMTDAARAQRRAVAASTFLHPAPGATRQKLTFAEWNEMLGSTDEPVGTVDPTTKIDFGEWVGAATGWMGFLANDVLTHLIRLGMTSTEWFDEAARIFVAQNIKSAQLEKKSVQDWWEYLRLAADKYKSSFANGVGEEPIPLHTFLNRILSTDLNVQAWYTRLRGLAPASSTVT